MRERWAAYDRAILMKVRAGRRLIVLGNTVAVLSVVVAVAVGSSISGYWPRVITALLAFVPILTIAAPLLLAGTVIRLRALRRAWRTRAEAYQRLGADAALDGFLIRWTGENDELAKRVVRLFPGYLDPEDDALRLLAAFDIGGRRVFVCEFSNQKSEASLDLHWQLIVVPNVAADLAIVAPEDVPELWVSERLRDRQGLAPISGLSIGRAGLLFVRGGMAAWLSADLLEPNEALEATRRITSIIQLLEEQRAREAPAIAE